MKQNITCTIFGGTGFIGSHFARFVNTLHPDAKVVLADIAPPRPSFNLNERGIQYVKLDVRRPIDDSGLPRKTDIIVNLAAIHREPGHKPYEYFETNLLGAENVCDWAEKIDCRNMIFTSSIAPYGPSESIKTEKSLPVPVTAYGSSKLAAEKIHMAWQRAGSGRKLVVVRPGVVFGPGEGGNVTRLVRAVIHRYFFYMGNRKTRKAGGYVKELNNTMLWALEQISDAGGVLLYNFSMQPSPTVEEYVKTICRVAGVRRSIPTLPFFCVRAVSYLFESIARLSGSRNLFSPVRIRKLVVSNNIAPDVLRQLGYQYLYSLDSAMLDWKRERPDEWR